MNPFIEIRDIVLEKFILITNSTQCLLESDLICIPGLPVRLHWINLLQNTGNDFGYINEYIKTDIFS
jgi:hypothetical protein